MTDHHSTANKSFTIYAAGPDVFRPDYQIIKEKIKQACLHAGMVALCPADDELSASPGKPLAQQIQEANLALIDRADAVMANVVNFRGYEPDSGTVFEIGYARGKGKPVWCYNVPAVSLLEQIPQGQPGHDIDGNIIEDFGLARNLMLAHGCTQVQGGVAQCVALIAGWVKSEWRMPWPDPS